jgi:serine/threonine protein phosphatase 1
MKNSTWAFGDIHGHYDQMMRLVKKCQSDGMDLFKDIIIFLGDIVDGGDQTKQVIDQLMRWQKNNKNIIVLYGNHEDLLLDALLYNGRIYDCYNLWWGQGGKATYESFLPKGLTEFEKAVSQVKDHITSKYLDWLRQLPLFYETDKYFFVHAGLPHALSIQKVKEILKKGGKDADSLKQKLLWIREEFIYSPFKWEKKIIFGHTVHKDPVILNNKIGLDGMFHNDGNLFAIELPSEKIYIEKSS